MSLQLDLDYEDEIETLLSESSNAIDPSLWETTPSTTATTTSTTSATTYSSDQPITNTTITRTRQHQRQQHQHHRCPSCLLCSAWLGLSIVLGILMTVAMDHREKIGQVLSQWCNQHGWQNNSHNNVSISSPIILTTTTTSNNKNNNNNNNNASSLSPSTSLDITKENTTITFDVVTAASAADHVGGSASTTDEQQQPQQQELPLQLSPEEESPHVVYDNLRYRRVCAPVLENYMNGAASAAASSSTSTTTGAAAADSILCLTIRYPFDVPLQDPTVSFPKPVPDQFYHQLQELVLLDGPKLDAACRQQNTATTTTTTTSSMHDQIYTCLEQEASSPQANGKTNDPNSTVVAVFTRRRRRQVLITNTNMDADAVVTDASDADDRRPHYEIQEDFYGTASSLQQRRVADFFRGHVVVILGASPVPFVTHCLADLFGGGGRCVKASRGGSLNCRGATASTTTTTATAAAATRSERSESTAQPRGDRRHRRRRQLQHHQQTDLLDETWLRVVGYYPSDRHVEPMHIVNTTKPLVQALQDAHISAGPAWLADDNNNNNNNNSNNSGAATTKTNSTTTFASRRRLRPLSILVEFPIAHSQTETMIREFYGQVEYNQVGFMQRVMNITTSREAQAELAETMGLKLAHVIAFDGLPQHFPSETGAYPKMGRLTSEQEFLDHPYEGWRPELGSTCRGPLPPNSVLKQVNDLERQAFATLSVEALKQQQRQQQQQQQQEQPHIQSIIAYGKTWEFSNQFWWQENMWKGKGGQLDCTHPAKMGLGPTIMHKFFLQAMIDGYYESQAR